MTVQWALLHPRGPQDDRAIAKRSCGTRDRSACAFQHLPHAAPTDGQVHTSRRRQSFSRDAFHGFLSGSRPLSEAANEVAIAATARNPESPGLTMTSAISAIVLSTVFSFHNQHLPLQ